MTVWRSGQESLVHQCQLPSETLPSGFLTLAGSVPKRESVPIPATEHGTPIEMSSRPRGSFRMETGRLGISFSDRILHHPLHAGDTQFPDRTPLDLGNHARKPVIVKVPRNPCGTGRFPPINHLRRAFPLTVLSPPTERVIAPDVASSTPDLREVVLEILGVVVGELSERTLHASSR